MLGYNFIIMVQEPHSLEFTKILYDGKVFHYTCNPPPYNVLYDHKIEAIGGNYGCTDAREVLIIPVELYGDYGYKVREGDIKIVSEHLLRKLDNNT